MLVKCTLTSVDASALTDPYCIVETKAGDHQVQPQVDRAVYCEVDPGRGDRYLRVRVKERTQLVTGTPARGKLDFSNLTIGGDEEQVEVELWRGNQAAGSAHFVVRACHDLDVLEMSIVSIRPFRSHEPLEASTRSSRLAGFYTRVQARDFEEKQKTRASGRDARTQAWLIAQTFRIPGAELGNALEIYIEEVKDLTATGRIEIETHPQRAPASGRYFCVDRDEHIRFEVHLDFHWRPSRPSSATQRGKLDHVIPHLAPAPAPELPEVRSPSRVGERDLLRDDRRPGVEKDKRKSSSAERKALKLLSAERARTEYLETQLQRQIATTASLDDSLLQLREENRQLKKTIKYLRPHWNTIEYMAGEYDVDVEPGDLTTAPTVSREPMADPARALRPQRSDRCSLM